MGSDLAVVVVVVCGGLHVVADLTTIFATVRIQGLTILVNTGVSCMDSHYTTSV